jgi:Protein of unknown function (DUF3486)
MRRLKVLLLPKEVRAELDRRLVDGAFSHYRELAEWLKQQGFAISPSSLHRYGSNFEARLAAVQLAIEQAKVLAEAAPDQEDSLTDGLTRLVQQRIWNVLVETNLLEDGNPANVAKIANAIAALSRASIVQKRWADQVQRQLDEQRRAAGEKVARLGLSPEAEQQIRAILLGIDPLSAATPPEE